MAQTEISRKRFSLRSRLHPLFESTAAQLVELALALPLLLALVAGIIDFGKVWDLKQKLNNAAREGARFGSSESDLDLTCSGTPCGTSPNSVVAIRDIISNYLTSENVTQCAISATGTLQSGLAWKFTSSSSNCGAFSLVIDRGYTFVNGSNTVVATHVSFTYPYYWVLFNRIIGVLGSSANYTNSVNVTTDAVMQNLP